MTKNEKQLVAIIQEKMDKKKITDNAATAYSILKRSNKDYFVEVTIGGEIFSANGQDSKEAIKNVIKKIK